MNDRFSQIRNLAQAVESAFPDAKYTWQPQSVISFRLPLSVADDDCFAKISEKLADDEYLSTYHIHYMGDGDVIAFGVAAKKAGEESKEASKPRGDDIRQEMIDEFDALIAPKKEAIVEQFGDYIAQQIKRKWKGPDVPLTCDFWDMQPHHPFDVDVEGNMPNLFMVEGKMPNLFMVAEMICAELKEDSRFTTFHLDPLKKSFGVLATPI